MANQSKFKALSPRREKFAQNRAGGMTVPNAHTAAGYADDKRNAYKLANIPEVARRIAEIMESAAGEVIATKSYVLYQLMDTIEKAKDMDWDIETQSFIPSKTFSLSAANAATKMLGDAVGAWETAITEVTTAAADRTVEKGRLDEYVSKYSKALKTSLRVKKDMGKEKDGKDA